MRYSENELAVHTVPLVYPEESFQLLLILLLACTELFGEFLSVTWKPEYCIYVQELHAHTYTFNAGFTVWES